ncbi:flagellar hook-length control protein FliK [Pseudomonas sp.]|uniref:flagellar hook-length control protein FliK n=1 Tax=Pseudomonas sp. TaxID=306 RepID=UPI003D14054E
MAVSPDFLLKAPSVDVRPKAAAKAPEAPREARDGAGSSFSDVYARERQAKPAERPAARDDARRDKVVDDKAPRDATETVDDEKPAVAESGNALPPEELPDDALQGDDPLLMFGLGGQFLPEEPLQDDQVSGETLLSGLSGLQQTSLGGEEPAADDLLAGLRRASDPQLALQEAAQESDVAQPAVQKPWEVDEDFAGALAAVETAEEPESEFELDLELLEGIEAPKGARAADLGESPATRPNPLSQAIAQQVQQAQRPAQVPGQPVQMQQAGWSEAVVDRVMWLSSQNLKSAEIQLDPAELGRMEVRIEMNKDQTQVTFLSPHAGVRDALEGQMVRLREMFSQQGMNLVDVNVSDQSLARGWQGGGEGQSSRNGFSGEAAEAGDEELRLGVAEVSGNRTAGDRGLVDYYA